jgi:hypothetical protein
MKVTFKEHDCKLPSHHKVKTSNSIISTHKLECRCVHGRAGWKSDKNCTNDKKRRGNSKKGEAQQPEELPTSEGELFCPAGQSVPILHASSLPGLFQLLVQLSSTSASWLDQITPSRDIITIPPLAFAFPFAQFLLLSALGNRSLGGQLGSGEKAGCSMGSLDLRGG